MACWPSLQRDRVADHVSFKDLDIFRMKKSIVLCALLAGTASAALAQESRQDVSISGTFLFAPQVNGNAAQLNTNGALGALASYR